MTILTTLTILAISDHLDRLAHLDTTHEPDAQIVKMPKGGQGGQGGHPPHQGSFDSPTPDSRPDQATTPHATPQNFMARSFLSWSNLNRLQPGLGRLLEDALQEA